MGRAKLSTAIQSISVVIPTYNRSNTILMAARSVLFQTVSIQELIVVDDCSDDNVEEALKSIDDPRLRVVRLPQRSGAPAARNFGIKLAKGDWIAFQDSDDYWFSHKLERQLEEIEKSPGAILCYCGLIQYYGNKATLVPGEHQIKREGEMYETLLQQSFISTQTILAKKSALEEVGGFREDMPRLQDWELVLRLATKGTFCCVREPLAIAYATPGNLTSDIGKGIVAILKIIETHKPSLIQHPNILSHHYHVIGKQLLATDQFSASIGYFLKAIRTKSLRPGSWFWMFVAASKASVSRFYNG